MRSRRSVSARLAAALCLILLPAVVLACSNDGKGTGEATPIEVSLGVVQSLTGAGSIYGRSVVQGIELAVNQLNDAPGARFHVTYTVVDDQSTVEGGNEAFTSLTRQKVSVLVGPTLSNVALEAHKIAQQAGIPTLGATTTAAGITATGNDIFRVALAEDVVVPATLQYVAKQTPLRQTILVFDSTDAFSRSSADAMRKGLSNLGAPAATEIDISKTPDVVSRVKALGDVPIDAFLITPLVDKSAPIVKDIRTAGFAQTIVGGNSFNTLDIVPQSGGAANGAYVGAAWNPGATSAESRRFVDAFTKAYGSAPDLYAGQGYASVQVLANALQRAGSADPKAIRDALAESKDVPTIFGAVSFDADRDAVHTPVVQQFREGKLVVLQ